MELHQYKAEKETIDVPPQKGNMRSVPRWKIRVQLAFVSRPNKAMGRLKHEHCVSELHH